MSETGDTPHLSDIPTLVDTSTDAKLPAPQGDSHIAGSVYIPPGTTSELPTAGELRSMGYVIDDEIGDADVPTTYAVDSPTPPNTVIKGDSLPGYAQVGAVTVGTVTVDEPAPVGDVVQVADVPVADDVQPETPEQVQADYDAEAAGRAAAAAGQPINDNPHDGRSLAGRAWKRGHDAVTAGI